ncbi:PQQ-binding-like beta-propeller repeat protein [Ktedonobacter robiniae]|uniref:Pyrrolo-quinoline quinone repeat domain-containing protein n=1 Tax=Ktedonobacter robiniae TaxID=2778365 RepID=A0ABQ3UZH4_9CHLR|nr:PQQ-binding-like beta-propeller repeat protein [Ktedonobacter robiniae]GHO57685.1 hypothetical protein KSB_61600 [Ktedonobacter robiniae]
METFLIKNGLRKSQAKRWFGFCAALGLMLVGSLACGPAFNRGVPPPPYDAAFGSSGDYQSTTLDRAATSEVLTMVVSNGPNITLCDLNPLNGLLRGHTDLSLHGSPIGYADGLLYVNERGGSDGHSLALCAVDISHGQVRWCQSQIQGALQGVFEPSYFSLILGANGIIYMSIFFRIIYPIKHINTPTTLTSAATVTPGPLAPTSPVATASPADSRPYSVLYAFNEANGRIVWQYSLGHLYFENLAPPLLLKLGQGMLYTEVQGSDDHTRICAIRARDGKQTWCQAFAHPILDGITLGYGTLYARTSDDEFYLSPGDDTDVYALDAANGALRWSVSLGPSTTGSYAPLIEVAGNRVYVNRRRCECDSAHPSSDDADYLFAFNASSGSL